MKMLRRFLGPRSAQNQLPRVAVLGALRSGTNYLRYLIEHNYYADVDINAFGWKHAGLPVFAMNSPLLYQDIPIIYIVKNPFAFALSLYRYRQQQTSNRYKISLVGAESWNDFLVSPVEIFDSQQKSSPRLRFSNPIQYWNFIYWNLETLDRKKFRVIGFNYEQLLESIEMLRDIEALCKLGRRNDVIIVPKNNLRRQSGTKSSLIEEASESGVEFDQSYYIDGKYLDNFTRSQRSFVGIQADPWIMSRRGYVIT